MKDFEVNQKVKYKAFKELKKGTTNKDVANQSNIPGSTLAT